MFSKFMTREIGEIGKYRNIRYKTFVEFLLIFSFNVAKINVATTHDYANKISTGRMKGQLD